MNEWFYIAIDLHARKVENVIINPTYRLIRGCPDDAKSRGSLDMDTLNYLTNAIDSTDTAKEIGEQYNFNPTKMKCLWGNICKKGRTVKIFKDRPEERSIYEARRVSIVDKFMGLKPGEDIDLEYSPTNLGGIQLVQCSERLLEEGWDDLMRDTLTELNNQLTRRDTVTNEFGEEEDGMYLSYILQTIQETVIDVLENGGINAVVFIADISCNAGLSPRTNLKYARQGAFGRKKSRRRRKLSFKLS